MKTLFGILCMSLLILSTSCTELEGYKDFTKDGEITYTGTAINLTAYSGDGRVKLTYGLVRNPNINKSVISWNSGKNSVVLDFDRYNSDLIVDDTLTYIVNDLPEGSYTFEIQNFDKLGHQSVPSSVISRSYGDKYRAELYDRPILGVEAVNNGEDIKTIWSDSTLNSVGVKVKYINKEGSTVEEIIPNTDNEFILKNCKVSEPFLYQTLYKPVENCLDTFSTPFVSYDLSNIVALVSRSSYSEYRCDNDSKVIAGPITNLWDGKRCTNPNGQDWAAEVGWANYDTGDTNVEGVFTLNLGSSVKIAKIRFSFYWNWVQSCPKRFEIYGYTGDDTPNKNGDWSQWTLLKSVNNTGNNNNAHYTEGEIITFDDKANAPKVQYIRVKNLENYSGGLHKRISFSEIDTWKYLN